MRRKRPRPQATVPFRRKDFYDLTAFCRSYALELAVHDQSRVNLKECYRFNSWLARLKTYDALAPVLAQIAPARPVARWQVMVLLGVVYLILVIALPGRVERTWMGVILAGSMFTLITLMFVPESLFGTTIELLDGKVLRVVEVLLEMLNSGRMEFSEAAFFRARENLLMAHDELRQQIDLAHR